MLAYFGQMKELPLSDIVVNGWLYRYLELQKEGLTGHLEQAGFPFDTVSWAINEKADQAQTANPEWWPYEQTAYWMDGMERSGQLLRDRELCKRVDAVIDSVIHHVDDDGYLGPKFLKNTDGWNRWPHVVFFRAMMAKYAATGDQRLVEAITKHYLSSPCDYSRARDVMNVEVMLWAYRHSGDERLLRCAKETYDKYNERTFDDNTAKAHLSRRKPYAHGVTYNEFAKLGAILYMYTGERGYLKASVKAYEKLEKHFMLVSGLHCSNEFLLDNDYMRSHETCDVSDYTWSLGYLLMATGNGHYADLYERCVFNAGFGSVDERFRALQYFSCPNQLVLDRCSNHNDFFKGHSWMSYRPNPGTECCPGNVNRFFPNYCARMYMQTKNGIAAVLYGASECSFTVDGERVHLTQQTMYPFDDRIVLSVHAANPTTFSLSLRIPSWCDCPSLYVNGQAVSVEVKNGFTTVERQFTDGDKVELQLPSKVVAHRDKSGGIYIDKGPLVYTLGMWGDRQTDGDDPRASKEFPAYNIYPDKDWNYALMLGEGELPDEAFSCTVGEESEPWRIDRVPCRIRVKARKVKNWTLVRKRKIRYVENLYKRPWGRIEKEGDFTFTPRLPTKAHTKRYGYGDVETITLVPMGCAKVRMTVLPVVEDERGGNGA